MRSEYFERSDVDVDPAPSTDSVHTNPPDNTEGADIRELVVRQFVEAGYRVTVSFPETDRLLGISKNLIYQLANRDGFPALMLGGRKVVSLIGLVDWVERQTDTNCKGGS